MCFKLLIKCTWVSSFKDRWVGYLLITFGDSARDIEELAKALKIWNCVFTTYNSCSSWHTFIVCIISVIYLEKNSIVFLLHCIKHKFYIEKYVTLHSFFLLSSSTLCAWTSWVAIMVSSTTKGSKFQSVLEALFPYFCKFARMIDLK